jgi:DNA-binding NarL/FixJ family response regulator
VTASGGGPRVPVGPGASAGPGGSGGPGTSPGHGPAVRVMVVDDHPMWRDAVARDLSEAGLEVVATAGDGAEALRRAPAARPDVVVLDLQMPQVTGVEVTRRIVAELPGTRILVLTASGDQADVLEAVKAGATGYLVKSASREELVAAVRRTARGEGVFTAGLAGLVLGEFRRLASAVPPGPDPGMTPLLTDRETEVLRLVAKGLGSRQIAERLVISHRTVQNHVQNVLNKLQLHNRVELTRYVIEQGLDEDPGPA